MGILIVVDCVAPFGVGAPSVGDMTEFGAVDVNALRDGREDLLALTQCTVLCDRLINEGVEELHFYTLNRPQMTRDVCEALGIVPKASLQKVA